MVHMLGRQAQGHFAQRHEVAGAEEGVARNLGAFECVNVSLGQTLAQ